MRQGAAPHAAAGSRWLPISYVLYVYWPSGLVAWLRSAPQTVTSRGRAGRPAPLTDSSCLLQRRAQALAAGPAAACCQRSAACRVRACVCVAACNSDRRLKPDLARAARCREAALLAAALAPRPRACRARATRRALLDAWCSLLRRARTALHPAWRRRCMHARSTGLIWLGALGF